ncbi:MAG: InlB B-repeat-containing protein [Lachnospiraceae bacterium]|nr:InlB B-repeat-containing protein [Lachnospiraceae bacterium]
MNKKSRVNNLINRSISFLMSLVMTFGMMTSNLAVIQANSVEDHEHIFSYISNGDGTHLAQCNQETECDYEESEECSYEEGICTKCGYENYEAALFSDGVINIYVKGESDSAAQNAFKDNGASVEYGQKLILSSDGVDEELNFTIKKSGSDEDDSLFDNNAIYSPGRYYIGWTCDENETIYYNGFEDYYFDIVPAKLAEPEVSSFDWNGAEATFASVSKDSNGNDITGDSGISVSYIVKIYKDNVLVKTSEAIEGVASDAHTYSLLSLINSPEGGAGKYAFSVTAISSDESFYTDSSESSISDSVLYVTKVTLDKESGISSANDKASSENTFLLISGDSTYSQKNIIATPDTEWQFLKWDNDNSNITIENENLSDTTITYGVVNAEDYNSEITVTAKATENNAPTIVTDSFAKGEGIDEGKIVAKSYDRQTGVKSYAFATEEPVADSAAWTILAESVITGVEVAEEESPIYRFAPTDSGAYKFYVKDEAGNMAVSDNTVNVSKINLDSYYVNDAKKTGSDSTILQIGDSEIVLPTDDISRKGYEFKGWYEDPECTRKITSITTNSGADTMVYAKWEFVTPTWSKNLNSEGYNYTYNGQNRELTVEVNTSADVTYEWFCKKDGDSEYEQLAESSDTLTVRNVSDSGNYYVKATIRYTDNEGVEQIFELDSNNSDITIAPKDLTVKADSKIIGYLGNIPEYTYTYYGLVGDDADNGSLTAKGRESITEGTLKCSYAKGDVPDSYDIEFDEHFASNGNYAITEEAGLLTVKVLNVGEIGAVINLEQTSYEYTGEAIVPVFTVTYEDEDGNTVAIEAEDFDISYDAEGNIKAGTHTMSLTFKRYYEGSLDTEFTITKGVFDGEAEVEIADWNYGESKSVPDIVTSTLPSDLTNYDKTYYYVPGELEEANSSTGGSTAIPTNAGTYSVYALIHDKDGNYQDFYTKPTTFEIGKRKIFIKAKDYSWTYDGNSHSYPVTEEDPGYTFELADGTVITEHDVFILPSESFASLELSGSVKDVVLDSEGNNIGVDNTVIFNMKANADNYDIECIPGVLKVNPAKLNVPAMPKWDDTKPGQATWVAITKRDLSVEYQLQLFVQDPDAGTTTIIKNGESDYFVTSDTHYDFSEIIHSQISTNSKKSFYFTIKTLVKDSSDPDKLIKNDYANSDVSAPSAPICTVTVSLTKQKVSDETDNPGIESIVFTDEQYRGRNTITLISGESFNIRVDAALGYNLNELATINSDDYSKFIVSSHKYIHDLRRYYIEAELTVKSDIAESLPDVRLTCNTEDDYPTTRNLTYVNCENHAEGVKVSAELYDGLSLKDWIIEKVTERQDIVDGKKVTTYEHDSYVGDWHNVSEDGSTIGNKWVRIDTIVTTPGILRIRCRDAENNWSTTGVFTVYEISFDKGDTDDTEHVMQPIYKLANTEISLPKHTYVKTGYAFQNWKGEHSGTSVDEAVYKANVSDVLVAQWTNKQYKYTVNYFYMDTEGNYSDEPESSEEFFGRYGEVIVASDSGEDIQTEAIQKPRKNYRNDPAPNVDEYVNSITLTENGQVLNIYYSSGNYKITYAYKIPGTAELTYEIDTVRYGAEVPEHIKPSVPGYDFVGWVYEGYGTAPDKMPAEDLKASGSFIPKQANYKVVYHMETLGEGDSKTGKYVIEDSLTQTLRGKHDDLITAYLTKDSATTANEVVAKEQTGFTINGMIITRGGAYTESDELPTVEGYYGAGTIVDKVSSIDGDMMYINYYFERNVYDYTLNVWKDNRESEANKKYTRTVRKQFGEDVSDLSTAYAKDETYIGNEETGTEPSLPGFEMPEGYIFTSYTDYSTGNPPSSMPGSDVIVTRDIISNENIEYTVEIYFEKSEIGSYDKMSTITYSAPAGSRLHVVKEETPDTRDSGDDKYIYYDIVKKTVNNSDYYQYINIENTSVEEGVLTKGGEPVVLKLYFERIYTDVIVKYRYGNTHSSTQAEEMASFTLRGKWGTTYEFDPDALFYANTDSDWIQNFYGDQLKEGATIKNGSTVNIAGTEPSANALQKNFYEDYIVSYACYYEYFDENGNLSRTWPNQTISYKGIGEKVAASTLTPSGSGYKVSNNSNVKLNNTVTCYFSPTKVYSTAYCYINYNQIEDTTNWYLNLKVNTDEKAFPNRYAEMNEDGTPAKDGEEKEIKYASSKDITFSYDGNNYPVKALNICDILNHTPGETAGEEDEYPAVITKKRRYHYSSLTDTKAGFTHIAAGDLGDDYFYYDGTGSLGSTPFVAIAVTDNRFMFGAYTSFSHNYAVKLTIVDGVLTAETTKVKSNEYKQVEDIMQDYQNLHSDSGNENFYDSTNTALYIYNTSWGSAYVAGSCGDLVYSYAHRDEQRITYMFDGRLCTNSEHVYPYATVVPKESVNCPELSAGIQDGYEVVWYTDGAHTNHIPDEGLIMNRNYTIYGQLEKTVIYNKEYIYYELADELNGLNYVTISDVSDPAIEEHITSNVVDTSEVSVPISTTQTVTKTAKTTEYYCDGVLVIVEKERPTCSYTELHLTKDTQEPAKSYEEAYGREGFFYDEANKNNRSYGYVNNTALELRVFFERDRYQVEIIANHSDTSNAEYKQFSIDHAVRLGEYNKDGYTLAGWEWEKFDKATGEYVPYTPSFEPGHDYFRMPAFDLRATAVWEPAEFEQPVTHYFQTSSQAYNTTFIASLEGKEPDAVLNKAAFNGLLYDASIYKSGAIEGVAVKIDDNTVYYFSTGEIKTSSTVEVKENDLVAATTIITVESEAETDPSEGAIEDFGMYSYSYTSCHSGTEVNKYTAEDKYIPKYGMTLEYFYQRSADLMVRLLAVSSDGGESGLVLTGGGHHMFGENVNIKANIASGYSFMGWYRPEDIFKDSDGNDVYDKDSDTELGSYPIRKDIESVIKDGTISPVLTGLIQSVTVTENIDLVAVSVPDETIAPTLSITGNQSYDYGYPASSSNAFMAIAGKQTYTSAEDPDGSLAVLASKTTITGYQWYRVPAELSEDGTEAVPTGEEEEIIEGQTSSTLLIERGKSAGAYIYRCKVSYVNSDTGRTGTIEKDRGLVVNKAKMSVEITNVEKIFDNNYYHITLNVIDPFGDSDTTIYYHADTPLDKDNYSTIGTTELPQYKDVNHDSTGACANKTYIYIKDNTGNYEDYVGYGLVNIIPKTISIKAKNQIFSKIYDASDVVTGDVTDSSTDLGKLAAGVGSIYELVGFVDGDTAVDSYILSCDARFNSMHVSKANSFTVSNMKLAFKTNGDTAYNYAFQATDTLTFSGHIEPRSLDIEWEDKEEFVYNGELQAPVVSWADTDNNKNIPESDKGKIILTTTGKQTNVTEDGKTYTAYAQAIHTVDAPFESGDYTFNDLSKNYRIVQRNIFIKPVDTEITYNGENHTITEYKIVDEDGNEDLVANADKYIKSISEPDTKVNAGIYDEMEFKHDFKITSTIGRDLTYNYNISYEKGTLTIKKAKVTVTGIVADDKPYDGTTDAVIHINNPTTGDSYLTFTPLYSQNGVVDKLDIDVSKIDAVFEDKAAGTNKVNITIPADALIGDSADNYELIPSTEVSGSQNFATATISQNTIKVKAVPKTVVYGESVDFECEYENIIKEDGTSGCYEDIKDKVTGSVSYYINTGTDEVPVWTGYTAGDINVGEYEIKVDVSSLSHPDFTFEWDEDEDIKLEVTKRPVMLAAMSATISKEYDGTTDVVTVPAKNTHYEFKKTEDIGGSEVSASGVLSKDATDFDLSSKEYVYNSKDVADADKVLLTDAVINNDNYELINDNVEIPGEITPIALTIRAKATEITYGDTSPSYEAEYDGFIDGETESVLDGELTFSNNEYDPSDSNKRHVGTYTADIIPTGFGAEDSVNNNYIIHYVPADMTVEPAVVYFTADDKVMRYKVGNEEAGMTGQVPTYTYTQPEWKYEGDAARYSLTLTMPQTETGLEGDTAISCYTLPKDYPIKIKTDSSGNVLGIEKVSEEDTHTDYIFKAKDGKLTVQKFLVKVTGSITIADRYYDGTDKIYNEQLPADYSTLTFDGIDDVDKSYSGIDVDKLIADSRYAGTNAGDSVTITLDIALNDYLAARYELDSQNTNVTASSSIKKRPVEIKAKDKTIRYGSPIPNDYGIETVPVESPLTSTNMGLVEGDTISVFTAPTGYTCAYAVTPEYSATGSYDVTPVGVTADNYEVNPVSTGSLTVTANKLATPVPQWNAEAPGTVTWTDIPSIGDVTVAGYIIELYKEGEATAVDVEGTKESPIDATTYDFASKIRENDGGIYKVKVKAIASLVMNDANCNVTDSDFGETVKGLYATRVTPVFDGSSDGIGAKDGGNNPVYINNLGASESYVIIEGESPVDLVGMLKNDTGYIASLSADTGITLGTTGEVTVSKDGTQGKATSTICVEKDAAPAAETNVIITLTARPATLKATISTTDNTSLTYGYTAVPTFTVTPSVVSDNIDTDGYDYTYDWYILMNKAAAYTLMHSGTESSYSFPSGYNVGADYRVQCKVTATRKDNGQKKEAVIATTGSAERYIKVVIKRGTYAPYLTYHTVDGNWVYGETREYPTIEGLMEEVTEHAVKTFKYSTQISGPFDTDKMYTDVGTYYVIAELSATENYESTATEPISYTITQNKLPNPANVKMEASSTAPYGKFTWDAVDGYKENAGAVGKSDSDIKVKYELRLSYNPIGESDPVFIGDPVITTDCYYDFTSLIKEPGTYHVSVKAIVDEKRGGKDALNCLDSDAVSIDAVITIGADVISDTGEADTTGFRRVYDGTPLKLKVNYSAGSDPGITYTYQWKKNGVNYTGDGANTDEISITYVDENAVFVCEVIPSTDHKPVYTKAVTATIIPRKITVSTDSNVKTYDGTPLTDGDYSIKLTGYDAAGLAAGDTDSINVKGQATEVADTATGNNTYDNLVIKRGDKVVYKAGEANNNYEVTDNLGTLTINKRQITLKPKNINAEYKGSAYTPSDYEIVSGTLVSGDNIDNVTYTGSRRDVGESTSNINTGVKIMKSGEPATDNTANYDITLNTGIITVTAKTILINTESDSKDYDGTALTKHSASLAGTTPLADGDSIDFENDITWTGIQTNAGESDNSISSVVVRQGTEDVTKNYIVTYNFGKLTVNKLERIITASDTTVDYDGNSHTITATATGILDSDNATTLLKYQVNGEDFAGAIERGEYVITITAPETTNYTLATKDVKLTIKRKIKITAASDSKDYDGTALTNSNYTVAFSNSLLTGDALASGDNITDITITGTQTVKGSSGNVPSGAVIKDSDSNDVTKFYEIAYVDGTLTIGQKTLTVTAKSAEWDYDATEHKLNEYEQEGLADGETLTVTFKDSSKITDYGTVTNEIDTVKVFKGDEEVTGNYSIITKSGELKVKKINLKFKPVNVTAVYDGNAHVPVAFEITEGSLKGSDAIGEVVYAGTRTDVGNTASGISSYKIKNGAKDVTNNYNVITDIGNIEITPYILTDGDLTISPEAFEYTGADVGPSMIKVAVDLINADKHDRSTVITEGSDYTVTSDDNKRKTASQVGTYTIEITGTGNYSGTLSKIYTITDNSSAVIKDGKENVLADASINIYCKEAKIVVTDPNLYSVVITNSTGEEVAKQENITEGTYSYTLEGQGEDIDTPADYTVTVKDVKGKAMDGTLSYNEQTVYIKLYPDHHFDNYTVCDKAPIGEVYEGTCIHDPCDAKDYIIKPSGTVRWDYNYSYSTTTGTQEGTKAHDQRATYARVDLYMNNQIVASKIVDCDSQCGISGAYDEGSCTYTFEGYNPYDAASDTGLSYLPYYNNEGSVNNFHIRVVPLTKLGDGSYENVVDYTVTYSMDNLPEDNALIEYKPGCFEVPWMVTLKDVPEGMVPEEIYVKILYASSEDDEDEDYRIITQQISPDNKGFLCDAIDNGDGTYSYSGEYPCWKYISGTTKTYYHRIQITGYVVDGHYVDTSSKRFMSACDRDHINHTVTYDPATDASTGTIQYTLNGLVPTLIFDVNYGSEDRDVYAILAAGIDAFGNGGEITNADFNSVHNPSRPGYTFQGWFTSPTGGTRVTGDVSLAEGTVRLYAHWMITKPAGAPNEIPSEDEGSPNITLSPKTSTSPTPIVVPNPVESPTNKPTDNGGKPTNDDVVENSGKESPAPVPSNKPNDSEGEDSKSGSLKVYVENTGDDTSDGNTNTDSPDAGEDKVKDRITGDLPDTEAVAEAVLTDEERKILEEGGNIVIRLTVDDSRKNKPSEEEDPALYIVLDQYEKESQENIPGGKAVFISFVDLKLEKSINAADWERILESGMEIPVVIDLPDGSVLGARRLVLARREGDHFVILEDLDDDPNTITFMTNDFESDYVLLGIEEIEELTEDNDCFWHWLILLTGIIELMILLITKSRKKIEEKDDPEITPEEIEKKRKRVRNIRIADYVLGTNISLIFAIFGTCWLDWPVFAVQVVVCTIAEYLKEKKKKEDEQAG